MKGNIRIASGLAAFLLCSITSAKEAAPPSPAVEEKVEDRVVVESLSTATAFRATLAGRVLSVAAPQGPGGARRLVLLVAPPPGKKAEEVKPPTASPCDEAAAPDARDTAPRRLVRLDPAGAGALVTLRDDLPSEVRDLSVADLDGDGIDELLLVRGDGVSYLRDDDAHRFAGAPALMLTLSDGELGALLPGPISAGRGKPAVLSIGTLGMLQSYGFGPDGTFGLRSSVELPLLATREGHGLDLSSPAVRRLETPEGVGIVVSAPEPRGSERLRTFVIQPSAPEAERRQEAWGKLPGAEKVLESSFLLLDGRPALAVTTIPAGKLSFFGEKLLRVFFLEADRTRAGKPPVAALQTGANLWQDVHITPADVNADGKQDLVVGYWKGLKDDTLVLDAYLRRPDGTFERSPRSTSFDIESADRGFLRYGDDLDGRGLPDLLLSGGGRLMLFPGGESASAGRRLVQAKPAWSAPIAGLAAGQRSMSITIGSENTEIRELDSAGSDPRVVDLDGDGRSDVVVPDGGMPGHVVVIVPHP